MMLRIHWWLRVLMALALVMLTGTWAVPAAVADARCSKLSVRAGKCKVSDVPDPVLSKKKRGAVDYPACSSIPGAKKSKPKDDEPAMPGGPPAESWVKITCRTSSGGLDSVWARSSGTGDAPGTVSPAVIAQSALAQLNLRGIEIGMVPDDCRGCRGAVGLPIWLWVDRPSRTTWGPASITAGGISLTAEVQKVVWSFGNGDSVSCAKGTVYRNSNGVEDSPTCGYRYPKQGTYTVTATSYWTAQWSGYGQSGTINLTLESTRDNVRIGEIQVLVTQKP